MAELKPQEYPLTDVGKLFFASLYKSLTQGTPFNWKLRGNPVFIQAFLKVVQASKNFQDLSANEAATVEQLITKMNERNAATKEFEQVTGIRWPL